MKIFGKTYFESKNVADEKQPASGDPMRKLIKPQQQIIITKEDQATLKSAIISAESIEYPNRWALYRVYKRIDFDAHLTGAVAQRKNLTLARKFIVSKDDVINEELTKMLQTKWFIDFIDLSLDSLFWGYSLIQFGNLTKDQFESIELVPRLYVKQEFHIVVDTPSALKGIDYLSGQYKRWCIGVGKSRDLGLYAKVASLVLWKQGAMAAWSNYQQLFGTPFRIGKTNVRDEVTRANMELMLRDMGQAFYAIIDPDDTIEVIETKNSDAFHVFQQMISTCNSEISKLILGQTGTMDEKSFVGSAEVMERVLLGFRERDEAFICNVLNYQLIPLLESHGIIFNGFTIEVDDSEDIELSESIKIDSEIMKYFDVDESYILEKYGVPVTKKELPVDNGVKKVKNSLDEYYS